MINEQTERTINAHGFSLSRLLPVSTARFYIELSKPYENGGTWTESITFNGTDSGLIKAISRIANQFDINKDAANQAEAILEKGEEMKNHSGGKRTINELLNNSWQMKMEITTLAERLDSVLKERVTNSTPAKEDTVLRFFHDTPDAYGSVLEVAIHCEVSTAQLNDLETHIRQNTSKFSDPYAFTSSIISVMEDTFAADDWNLIEPNRTYFA